MGFQTQPDTLIMGLLASAKGCAMASGTMGLVADLTAGEILEQLVHAQRVAPIQNVVFMVRL